jgi:opacity protein-like surface antigen
VPDVAAGIQNLAIGQEAVPYLVATTAPWAPDKRGRGAPGLSLGVIRPSGSGYQLLAGLSYNLSPNVQLVADGITGPESYRTVGVIANLSKEVTLNLAYAKPNDSRKNPDGFIFNLAYTVHLKGGGQSQGGPSEKNPTPGGSGRG